ncbi:hypothetical protein [Kutzneria sp. CA-103260]|uniref:hypothetical protein n=1 Tax=Kutzneria sp. CA-103260 TaxID=2802641 RepID=UPI001BA52A3E|nr:hypothetical protein [Kutzneria sp. CA-103260]QUQ66033.1 hypothetical protein JJ691_37580 [Kutzneria sp. CA-103260]
MTAVANTPSDLQLFAGDRIVVGEAVDALIMRAGFGAEVNGILTRCMLHAPIILSAGRRWEWIFLTQARTALRQATWADLVRIQVGWLHAGAELLLPTDDADGTAERRWQQRPLFGQPLPPWTAVVSAARSASSVCGLW